MLLSMSKLKNPLIWYPLFLIAMAQIVLPSFNKNQDWLIFTTWNLFSSTTRNQIRDMTWDNGHSFFLRDFKSQAQGTGFNTLAIHGFLEARQFEKIKAVYKNQLINFCKCEKIEIVEFDNTYWDFYMLKENANITSRFEL